MTDRTEILLQRAGVLDDGGPTTRRREELIQRATDAGHTREYADQIYDVASEEGVDPAAAFELVLCGVGVRDLAGVQDDQWEETQGEAPPPWLAVPAPDAQDAARERHIRASFRRLRHIMEKQPSAREALRAFVEEADVGDVDYFGGEI